MHGVKGVGERTAEIAVVEQGDGGHFDNAAYAGAGRGGVSGGLNQGRWGSGWVGAYKTPMLMAMATPIFSLLYMLKRSKSLQGNKASAMSQNAETAGIETCQSPDDGKGGESVRSPRYLPRKSCS